MDEPGKVTSAPVRQLTEPLAEWLDYPGFGYGIAVTERKPDRNVGLGIDL